MDGLQGSVLTDVSTVNTLNAAMEQARVRGHGSVGSEHLLPALLDRNGGTLYAINFALNNQCSLSLGRVYAVFTKLFPRKRTRRSSSPGPLQYNHEAKLVVAKAVGLSLVYRQSITVSDDFLLLALIESAMESASRGISRILAELEVDARQALAIITMGTGIKRLSPAEESARLIHQLGPIRAVLDDLDVNARAEVA